MTGAGRLAQRFLDLATANRAAFIPYIMAGDPDAATTARLLSALPGAGADIIDGGAGDDMIWGGDGADSVDCGDGDDFYFDTTTDVGNSRNCEL